MQPENSQKNGVKLLMQRATEFVMFTFSLLLLMLVVVLFVGILALVSSLTALMPLLRRPKVDQAFRKMNI